TGLGTKRGAMPPWFIEKDKGIQQYRDDPSLSEAEIAVIARWADSGAPRGNDADMPPPRKFSDANTWTIGAPDLIVRSPEIDVPAQGGDYWGSLGTVPMGLEEDRYVSAVEVREINDTPKSVASTSVGGRVVVHHLVYATVVPGSATREDALQWPAHEI